MQKLRVNGRSAVTTIPKHYLERDGVVEDGEFPEEQNLAIDRLGERTYVIRLVDGGDIPELTECEEIEQIVAKRLLQEGSPGQLHRAD